MAVTRHYLVRQISSDKPKTFRNLLKTSLNNPETSALLIGEIHGVSPSYEAILANIDLLSHSKRKVVLLFEALNQEDNHKMAKAFAKAQQEHSNPLKSVAGLQKSEVSINLYTVILAAINHGIKVMGCENVISNPFCNKTDADYKDPMELVRGMEKFQRSADRIRKPNEVFSSLINSLIDEKDVFCIFIGGAAHPVELRNEADEVFDAGMKRRIHAQNLSVFLIENKNSSVKENEIREFTDRHLYGVYDYAVGTNKFDLYKDSFQSQPQVMDKIKLLNLFCHNLITGYLYFHKQSFELKQEIADVISCFEESVDKKFEFPALHEFIDKIIELSNTTKPEERKNTFFKQERKRYSRDELHTKIHHDLSEFVIEEFKSSVGNSYSNE
ncbi:hypothetical protein [Legionella jordanis]|uniref:Uncharacterized protein n=1 Tax=Legionella jordanis TaxID=456 RepID=A0A0W0VFA1_9GAMM|nr:hypothetical protein [Legionella jordanis]KTD18329.1 hypothetical protein Ljor_2635 [Legionella jordanis]RMX05244.1 hypothetical protein EAW55_00845 [Legionella jordanis]VEH13325.1 Uncharacterised protein [Legionella jordanis]HAT8713673.1 hypothetical protein [Legionella jordanis]